MSDDGIVRDGKPLLDWLQQRFTNTPRSRLKQWIVRGRISVRGKVIRRPHELIPDPGDALVLQDRRELALDQTAAWQIHPRVAVLHLDADLAVLNKGPGLISVPASNCKMSALSILHDFLAGRLKVPWRNQPSRTVPPAWRRLVPLPVHRLDQYTTGVFCAGMNPEARAILIEQLKERTMRREYVAFVEGRLPEAKGTWRNWLRLSDDEMRQQVVDRGPAQSCPPQSRQAVTHYEVVAEYRIPRADGFITKLRLRLETGLKHQIRVQAANAGVPLIGDRVYHPAYRPASRSGGLVAFARQALHSHTLSLEHPAIPGKQMAWTAAIPDDMRRLEAALLPTRM